MEGSKLVTLVKHFDTFHAETGEDDLVHFSIWLNKRLTTEKPNSAVPAGVEDNRFIVWTVHNLSKLFRWYAKGFLNAQGLSSMEEYFFLIAINNRGNPTKGEVYKDTISEVTTGAQMMRRLIESGLVKETSDTTDKRVRRVQLTAKGKKVREAVFESSKADLVLKAGNLSDEERLKLKEMLTYLERFHRKIYEDEAETPLQELITRYLR